jgi:putative component of membrane protein insertase Oxa1/YidC/SpoIIIJ protein YidD
VSYLGRTPAVLAIRAYRRWVSGRGPLRGVCCTFASTESCSAYGLRATRDLARSLPEAVRLVRARVRSCRGASIYRFEHGLGWERDHEHAPCELARKLLARGERADTIAQVIAARMTIARWRGERDVYRPVRAPHPIPVRAGDAAIRAHRRTLRRAAVLVLLACALAVVSLFALVPLALGIVALANARASARRLERQRVAATFLRPAVSPMLAG